MTRFPHRYACCVAIALLAAPSISSAQEPISPPSVPDEVVSKIRTEALEKSKVMETLSYLTDVIGPRLTNSPGMKRANEWTRDTMAGYGMGARLEEFGPFGRGWELKKFDLQVIEPQCIPIIAYPKAWSPGVEGEIEAPIVHLKAEKPEDLEQYKGKLKGAIVLVGDVREVEARFEPLASRRTDENLLGLANAMPPGERGRPSFPAGRPRPDQAENDDRMARLRAQLAVARVRDQFLIDEGAAAILSPSSRGDGGTLFVQSATVPTPESQDRNAARPRPWSEDAPKILPQIVLAVEHFNRLARMIAQGEELTAALTLDVEFQDDDLMGYNTIAEIPGSDPDLKDQVVMLGGHLDSWHSSTCATDNAAGCAVAMEAARILTALDLKPRRTVRVALWSGEEQGLIGSRAYVAEHFGARNESGELEIKPEHEKFSAYYNLDNGTGKIRGVYLQGNEAARPYFRKWLAPFADLGASTVTPSNTGGTDHQSFDALGLPGFQFIQDPVEYDTRTHHSNMDEFDRAQADDLKQAAAIMATFVYQTAQMDELLPRKPMPGSSSREGRPAAATEN